MWPTHNTFNPQIPQRKGDRFPIFQIRKLSPAWERPALALFLDKLQSSAPCRCAGPLRLASPSPSRTCRAILSPVFIPGWYSHRGRTHPGAPQPCQGALRELARGATKERNALCKLPPPTGPIPGSPLALTSVLKVLSTCGGQGPEKPYSAAQCSPHPIPTLEDWEVPTPCPP